MARPTLNIWSLPDDDGGERLSPFTTALQQLASLMERLKADLELYSMAERELAAFPIGIAPTKEQFADPQFRERGRSEMARKRLLSAWISIGVRDGVLTAYEFRLALGLIVKNYKRVTELHGVVSTDAIDHLIARYDERLPRQRDIRNEVAHPTQYAADVSEKKPRRPHGDLETGWLSVKGGSKAVIVGNIVGSSQRVLMSGEELAFDLDGPTVEFLEGISDEVHDVFFPLIEASKAARYASMAK